MCIHGNARIIAYQIGFGSFDVRVLFSEQIPISRPKLFHELFQSAQIENTALVDITWKEQRPHCQFLSQLFLLIALTVKFRQHITVGFIECRQCVRVDMQVGQMWDEIVANQKTHEDPIVNYALDVIFEADFVLHSDKL